MQTSALKSIVLYIVTFIVLMSSGLSFLSALGLTLISVGAAIILIFVGAILMAWCGSGAVSPIVQFGVAISVYLYSSFGLVIPQIIFIYVVMGATSLALEILFPEEN